MTSAVSRLPLAAIALALALSAPAPAATTATRPTFPLPASARVPPSATAAGTSAGATSAGGASAPATTVPTTTSTTSTVPPATLTTPGSSAVSPLNRTPNARLRTPAHASDSGHVSTEAVVLAAIAALLLLACAVWAFARSRAYEPHWLVSLRHAMAEAGFRTSATWAEFTDWARIGR
jgi:hypothetical protein